MAVFPELTMCGYSIDDLFLQQTLLQGVEVGLAEVVEGSADLLPVLVVGAPLVHGTRVLNCAVVIHRGRVLGVAPKSYLPTYREFYERRWFAPGDDRRGSTITVAGQEVPLGPDLVFEATDVPGLKLYAEICEDMWVPVPPSAEAALAGATVLANLSGSPITVARAEDRRLLVRSASARCSAAYVFAAAGQGESTTDLSWDGQTMVYECGDLLGESERFPEGARRTVVDVDLDRIRQDRIRQGTFDDNRRSLGERVDNFRTVTLRAQAAHRRHRAAPQGRPVPVRARRRRAARARLLRGLQHPGLRARAAAARHRPAEGRDRGQRRPRLHPRADRGREGDGPARPRAQRHPRLHDAGLRHRRDHEVLRHPPLEVARRDVRGDRHHRGREPAARRPRAPVRRRPARLRRHVRERPGRAAHRLPLPARQPPRRHRARHRRPVRARPRLVHVRRRRPDVALQRQRRRARRR